MKGIGLFIIAVILSTVLFCLSIIYTLIFHISKFDRYCYKCAITIDQSGTIFCSYLFNRFLLIGNKKRYEFGHNPDETISGVIGKNYLLGCLSPLGMWLYNFLDKRDPNHSLNAIEVDETYKVKVDGKTVYKEETHTEIKQ